jgi:hypothetical protein
MLPATIPAFAQIVNGGVVYIDHPGPGAAFQIAEAYPGSSGIYTTGIVPNRCFSGPDQSTENVTAVPGILCLARTPDLYSFKLNVNAFATCPTDQHGAVVQSFRLKKEIPGSMKCPNTYRPATYWQFGSAVRTWWTLLYTQPGTTFTLEVTVRCLTIGNQPRIHIDRWVWKVVATMESVALAVRVLHQNTIGTLEVPCIIGEDMYQALIGGLETLRQATTQVQQQDALFNVEALLMAYSAFGEFVDPDLWFPNGPPGNLAPMTPYATVTGIIDTLENPCACKVIADLEYIGIATGIVTP